MFNYNDVFFIDIRNSDEVLDKQFDPVYHRFINIPANHIRFNLEFIRSIVRSGDYSIIYLVCNSGRRSAMIYNKYFANDPDLSMITVNPSVSFKYFGKVGTITNISDENNLRIYTTSQAKSSFNLYNITRVIQLLIGTIMIIIGLYIVGLSKCICNAPIGWILITVGLFTLYSGISGLCVLSRLFGFKLI